MTEPAQNRPPRDDLFRALTPSIELVRSDPDDDGAMPTLTGQFAVFNEWTEINSMWEGNFLERIAPGSFKKTFRENRAAMRVLFNHGKDPQIGDKVLGKITDLREQDGGAFYEVPLFDTAYNRELIPGLDANVYGASFRFRVLREEFVEAPDPSDENPRGLPERTIKETAVSEFGPVTFPAYAGATAGLRSLTDEFLIARLMDDPERLQQLLDAHRAKVTVISFSNRAKPIMDGSDANAPDEDSAGNESHPVEDSAETESHPAESRREPKDDLFWFVPNPLI